MHAARFDSYTGDKLPRAQASPSGNGQRQRLPPGQYSSNLWIDMASWIQANTFAPRWLPAQLRRPVFGYLAAALVEGAAVGLIVAVLFLVPSFSYYAIFTLMGVVLIALGWGTGPGLLATLMSTVLLDYVVGTPRFSWAVNNLADGAGLVVYLVVGASISVLAGRSQRALQQATAKAHLLTQAEARSRLEMDTFLGIASHELKTPLTSLKLSVQVAERRLSSLTRGENGEPELIDPGLQRAIAQLSRTSLQMERLQRLVDDLLDVSRIQAGKLELRPSQTDLVLIVRSVVEEQEEVAPKRTISLQCPADLSVLVYADAARVEQVVTNFLTNALKYSAAHEPVDIGVEVEARQARVWVRDHGPGLPFEEQEHIWDRFHRVRDIEVQTGTGVGLGLGLYISRMIIERHQGQIGIESAPGRGSTFWFTLSGASPE